jgi:tetratricopeptide (TPR) repeat protein
MAKSPRLKNAVRDQIAELQRQADKLQRKNKFRESVDMLVEALALIPSPATDYDEYQWLWFSIADAYTSMASFEDALAAYEKLAEARGVLELPMYHIDCAKCLRTLGRSDESLDAFCEAKRLLDPNDWKEFFEEVGEEESIGLVEQLLGRVTN